MVGNNRSRDPLQHQLRQPSHDSFHDPLDSLSGTNLFLLFGLLVSFSNQMVSLGAIIKSGLEPNKIELSVLVTLLISLASILSILLKNTLLGLSYKSRHTLIVGLLVGILISSLSMRFLEFGANSFLILFFIRFLLGVITNNLITIRISLIAGPERLHLVKRNQVLSSFAFFTSILIGVATTMGHSYATVLIMDLVLISINLLIFCVKSGLFGDENCADIPVRNTSLNSPNFYGASTQTFTLFVTLLIFSFIGVFNCIEVPYLSTSLKINALNMTSIYVLTASGFFLGTAIFNHIKASPQAMHLSSLVICLISTIGFFGTNQPTFLMGFATFFGFGNGMLNISAATIYQESSQVAARASFIFISNLVSNFGILIGTQIAKHFVDLNHVFGQMLVLGLFIFLIVLCLSMFFRKGALMSIGSPSVK